MLKTVWPTRSSLIQNRLPFIGALGFGFIAGVPWLLQYSYSRGYDLFLWIYNAWYFRQVVADFRIPNWSHFSAVGQPFFKIGGLSDCVILALLSVVCGTFGGVKAFVVLFYLVAAAGCWVLAREVVRDRTAAAICAAAYVLSWFLSINVYFQGYLSNFMSYALLPWFLYLFYTAVHRAQLVRAVAAGLIFFLSIASNPQVALKLFVCGAVWVGLTGEMNRSFVRSFIKYSFVVGLVGAWGAFFNIVSALSLRPELVKVAGRRNGFHSPHELFRVPVFALNWIAYKMLNVQLVNIPLVRLPFSGYPGLSVVALAIASWGWFKATRNRHIRALWIMCGGLYFIYFFVLGLLPASSWFGISHNLLAYPTLFLALLSGFGVSQIRDWAARRFEKNGIRWSLILIVLLIVADLGGAGFCLNYFAVTHTAPAELPEVRAWKTIEDKLNSSAMNERFFSYNPDHTFYLYPVIMNRPVANIIELRQRNQEYQMYLDFLRRQIRDPHRNHQARLLSLLNVRFIDVPSKAYSYNTLDKVEGADEAYIQGLRSFDRDPLLQRIFQRKEEPEDWHFARRVASLDAVWRKRSVVPELAQVIYASSEALPGFIPSKVIAITGNTLEGERIFEEIVQTSLFAPAKIGFLLIESMDVLNEREKAALAGFYPVGNESEKKDGLSLSSTKGLYESDRGKGEIINFHLDSEEVLEISVEPASNDRYVFISQQYFKDWRAYTEEGNGLSLHKAGAGLSAVFAPAGTDKLFLRYNIPWYENWARLFSLLGLCSCGGLVCWTVLKRKISF